MIPFYAFKSWSGENITNNTDCLPLSNAFFIDKVFQLKWEIEEIRYLNVKTLCSYIFKCKTKWGNCILKITEPKYELFDVEINAIDKFNGNNCCKIFDYDRKSHIQLLECLYPGTSICTEKFDDRLKIAIDIAPEIEIDKNYNFSNYFNIIPDYLSRSEKYSKKYPSISLLYKTALNLLHEINADKLYLIHGDYHYENILKSGNVYKFIDPKGILGLKYMDYTQLLINELKIKGNRSDLEYLHFLMNYISNLSNTTYSDIAKWFFIENVWRFSGSILYMKKTEKYILEKLQLLNQYMNIL